MKLKYNLIFLSLIYYYYFSLLLNCFEEQEEPAIYLVLLEGKPLKFHQDSISLAQEQDDFKAQREFSRNYAKILTESHDKLLQSTLEDGSYKKLYSFCHSFNGFAIHTTPSKAKVLEKAASVVQVEKDTGVKLMTTYTPYLLDLPEQVWCQKGVDELTGDGIVIGVVDTGINPTHPSFANGPLGTFAMNWSSEDMFGVCDYGPGFPHTSCNGKIVSARYFLEGAVAALQLNASEDLSPSDEVGHGSHVASIAAGNAGIPVVVGGFSYGTASGMAPRARLAVYKTVYPEGGTLADLISAIDQAIEDNVDVLVLSVGPDEPPETSVTFMSMLDISLLFARKAGIFVAQAAGNKGPSEASVVSFSPWTMSVACSTTGRNYTTVLVTGNGTEIKGVGLSAPSFGFGLLQYKLVSAKDAAKMVAKSFNVEECQKPEMLQPPIVKGNIVVCVFSEGFKNGTSKLTAIIDTAKALGWMGFVLVANSKYGDFVAQPVPFSVPGVLIPRVSDAQVLLEYYEKNTCRDGKGVVISYGATAAITDGRIAEFTNPAQVVARYSSRGPDIVDLNLTAADILKPNILAPGDQIWGAWSPTSALNPLLSGSSFALISGTSMAAPHVGGIAALVKQFHPSWTPSMIASAMSTTAVKHDSHGLPLMAQGADLYSLFPATPFDYGAGLINPSAALDPALVLPSEFEDYIMFLCSLPNIDQSMVKSVTGVQCNGSFTHPADLNQPSITVSALLGFRTVRRHVINVSGKPETYLCSVLEPEAVKVRMEPCSFTILPEGRQDFVVHLNATGALQSFSFGEIVLTGSLNHIVRLPLAIWPLGEAMRN